MKKHIVSAISLYFIAASTVLAAPCDVLYEVQPDDKLTEIARVAYGSGDYQVIYSRNLRNLPSLAELPVGQDIVVPCLPGELGRSPDAVALAFRMLPLEAFTSMSASAPRTALAKVGPVLLTISELIASDLALLTANDGTVLAGEDLPDGGVIPALVQRALIASDPLLGQTSLSFIDDRETHVETLLPRAGFVLSFPWRKPECNQASRLSKSDQILCRNYVFSDPIYAVVIGVFTKRGRAPNANEGFKALSPMKICASDHADLKTLQQSGAELVEANLRVASESSECFELLANGEVDALVADSISAGRALRTRDDAQEFEEAPRLAALSQIHAIAFQDSEVGMTTLSHLNGGLAKIKNSGEWFQIINRVLTNP